MTYLSPAFVKDCVVNLQKRLRERIPDTNVKSSVNINYNIYIIDLLYAGDYRVITATPEFNWEFSIIFEIFSEIHFHLLLHRFIHKLAIISH